MVRKPIVFLALLVMGGFAKVAKPQALTTFYSFSGPDGSAPYAGLTTGSDGSFYGTTSGGGTHNLGTAFKLTPSGTFTSIYNFGGPDGSAPYAGLTPGSDQNFYGTTYGGGTGNAGTVFKLTPTGTLTTLHSFGGSDGAYPLAAVTLGGDGNFYGTTSGGGANGCGTVFKVTPAGVFTTLYAFSGADGSASSSALILGSNGSFYGTTTNGGSNTFFGTVFSITPAGVLTTLHSFGFTDGSLPYASLAPGAGGNFFGATLSGGPNIQFGTIFSMTSAGAVTTIHSFTGSDGAAPEGALLLGADGNFYGTSASGGSSGAFGTIFKITPTGTLTTLYNFIGPDAAYPAAGLAWDNDGELYGVSTGGGAHGLGAVFRLVLCPSCPETAMSSSSNPSMYGSPVTLTVSVAAEPGPGTPTGSVVFSDGGTPIGSAQVTAGAASIKTSSLAIGQHSLTAAYGGDANFQPATANLSQVVNPIATTTAIATSLSSSAYGQPVTFTATVIPGAASFPVTGTVTFTYIGTTLGVVPLVAGMASVTSNALSVGTEWVDATYGGAATLQPSTGAVSQIVNQAATSITLTSSLNPASITQQVTFSATVTGQYGGTPTGTITFLQNGAAIGSPMQLAAGAASVAVSFSTPGTYSITAVYSGDSNYATATTPLALAEVVNGAATSTSLTSSGSPSIVGHAVTFTATVVPSVGKTPDGGQVTFYNGGSSIGTGVTANGVATFATSTLPVGNDAITAAYAGNASYLSSKSAVLTQTVARNTTTATLGSSLNPSMRGQSVAFTATVSSAGPTPTGMVVFENGTAAIGTATLSGGVAVFSTAALLAGTNSITAVYGGDPNSSPATSAPLSQVVNLIGTSTSLASSKNPSTYGQAVAFTAVVTPPGGSVTPSGTVTFADGAATLGVVTLAGGSAAITPPTLNGGTHSISATYSGDSTFKTSHAGLQQVVNPLATATAIVSSKNPSTEGAPVTFTANVTAAGLTPSGSVTFTAASTVLGTVALTGGTAKITTSTLLEGTTLVTATFNGAANFGASSASVKQTVTETPFERE